MYGIKIASIALLASAVTAQQLPTCANTCLAQASGATYNGCNQFDIACICNSKDWIAGLACCVAAICDTADQDGTIQYANTICSAAGVTTLPQTATCASGVATSYASSASTTAIALSSVLAAASTATATASSASSAVSASTGSSITSASTPSATSTTTRSSTTSAAAANTSGAANINKANALGLGAFIAVAAVL